MKRLAFLMALCIMGLATFAQDIQELQALAQQGDAAAQCQLYCCYIKESRNIDEAVQYLLLSAENDYPEALYRVGCLYINGKYGFPLWEEKAKEYLFRAYELGYKDAKYKLEELTEEYEKEAKKVRRAVYRQVISVAPREYYFKYSENKRELIRQ